MPVDLSVFDRQKSVLDQQQLQDAFNLKKAAAIADIQKAQQIDADKLGEQAFLKAAQGLPVNEQEAAALKYIDAKSGGIMFDPVTKTVMQKPSILTRAGMTFGGNQPQSTQPTIAPKTPAPAQQYTSPEADAAISDVFNAGRESTPSKEVVLNRPNQIKPYTNPAMESELMAAEGNPSLQQTIREKYSGQFTPTTIFEQENKLRDEFNANTKSFRTVQDAYSKIQKTGNSGTGDMSMLYQYVKLLDPDSVVRESEFAAAAAAGNFGEQIQGLAKSIVEGGRLPESLRNKFLQEADNIYQGQLEGYNRTKQTYTGLAQRNNVSPENVVTDYASPVKTRLQNEFEAKKANGKLIGTSNGKRVWQLPNGSHVMEE